MFGCRFFGVQNIWHFVGVGGLILVTLLQLLALAMGKCKFQGRSRLQPPKPSRSCAFLRRVASWTTQWTLWFFEPHRARLVRLIAGWVTNCPKMMRQVATVRHDFCQTRDPCKATEFLIKALNSAHCDDQFSSNTNLDSNENLKLKRKRSRDTKS